MTLARVAMRTEDGPQRTMQSTLESTGNTSATMWVMTFEEGLTREAQRVNERYLDEVVERFGLCPWAAASRREGRVKTVVLLQESPTSFDPSLAAIAELSAVVEVEIGLFVYPRFALGRLDFEHFVRQLRKLDADRHEPGALPFAMAAFHPDAAPDTASPERLIPFLRRTPDPTLQLVRYGVLERARGQFSQGTEFFDLGLLSAGRRGEKRPETLREHLSRVNLATALEVGLAELEAVFRDIRRDRDQAYEALAERYAVT